MTHNRPHHHGHRQRLRQRCIQHGLDGFADYEVVELLLTLADVRPIGDTAKETPSPR